MANNLDPRSARAARDDARRLSAQMTSNEAYPAGTKISRPNHASRMFTAQPWTGERDGLDVDLSRASFEVAQARLRLDDAVARAADAGASPREIAQAIGTHQVVVHRILARRRSQPPLPGDDAVNYERPEARFHYELHREIARHVLAGNWSVHKALLQLSRMRTEMTGAGAQWWLDEWQLLLSMPTEDLVSGMLRTDDHGDDLRQVSPLSGVVSPELRAAALNRAYGR